MPVIEYCAFLAALCLNCGATGPAALEVTARQGCDGECWEPRSTLGGTFPPSSRGLFWMWACRLWAFCRALLGRGIWLSSCLFLTAAAARVLSAGYLSQHEHFSTSRHSWLQDSFETWKVSASVWTHYAVCIFSALLLNWDDACVFCCFSFVALTFRIVFLIVSWGCLRSLK